MKSIVVILLLGCLPLAAYSQNSYSTKLKTPDITSADVRAGTAEDPVMEAVRKDSEIELILDGSLTEPLWDDLPIATNFTQRMPDDGAPASKKTEVKILYTDSHIIVGMKGYDNKPDSIKAPLFRRDGDEASDWFHVAFDSYNDERTAFVFGVNPRGVQRDFMITDNTNEDNSWDAVWEARAEITDFGWTAEMKIPLSQLRFSSKDNIQEWGINFQRSIARTGEESFWSPTPQTSSGLVSNFGALDGISNLAKPRRLEVMPYISSNVTRIPPQTSENPYYSRNSLTGNAGGDVKYGISSDLTLSATINPDFGQVEADPAVINLTANEVSFDEKRPFFLEGRDIFRFGQTQTFIRYSVPTPFYSRRIGRSPQGNIAMAGIDGDAYVDAPDFTTIAGAAKLSGKTQNGWSLGLLDAYTVQEKAHYTVNDTEEDFMVEPATNYLVGRAKKDFNRGSTYVGGFASAVNRSLNNSYLQDYLHSSAYLGGMDYEHRFGNQKWISSGALSFSSVNGSSDALQRTQQSPVRYYNRIDSEYLTIDNNKTSLIGFATELSLKKAGGDNWLGAVTYSQISPGFESNDMGFQTRSDLKWAGGVLVYRETSPKHLQYYEMFVGYDRGWNYDGDRLRNSMMTGAFLKFNNLWSFDYNLGYNFKQYTDRVTRGGPVMERPQDWNLIMNLNTNSNKTISFNVGGNLRREVAGEFDNTIWTTVKYRPASFLQLDISPEYSYTKDVDQYVRSVEDPFAQHTYGHRYVFADISQHTLSTSVRLNWTFSPKMSLQTYVRPFIATGDYYRFKEFARPNTYEYSVYGEDKGSITAEEDGYRVNPDGATIGNSFRFDNPDFNFRSVQGNAVFRWEYMPGSTLFLVWQQQREEVTNDGNFDFSRDVDSLFRTKATNVFLVKLSYWFGK